jgi:hypothetical protein
MTRTGKIARLPLDIRNELNARLANGEQGKRLVAWLNSHPEVNEVLDLDFDGRPITEQNLSEWKKGGHRDWQRHQKNLDWARVAADEAQELNGEGDAVPLSDRLAPLAALSLGRLIRSACSSGLKGREDRRQLLAVVRELAALRAGDHSAARLKMDLRRWEEEKAAIEKAAARRAYRERFDEVVWFQQIQSLVSLFTEGMTPEQERKFREWVKIPGRVRSDPPSGNGKNANRPRADQSNPIQPNLSESKLTASPALSGAVHGPVPGELKVSCSGANGGGGLPGPG